MIADYPSIDYIVTLSTIYKNTHTRSDGEGRRKKNEDANALRGGRERAAAAEEEIWKKKKTIVDEDGII